MVSVCFYFQVHQPYRMNKYAVFDIGKKKNYFNEEKNREIIHRVSEKCYKPANKLMLSLIQEHPEFKISYSFSGTVLEQLWQHEPDVVTSFAELVDTGNVEILDETYYHSLASMYSPDEFIGQVAMHSKAVRKMFNVKPKIFRNTELIYNNDIARLAEIMGYKGILAEGADHVLQWRSPAFVYRAKGSGTKLLLKHYRLSDDIAFRFSSREWNEWPLKADKFSTWINSMNGNGQCANLFMDYETLGEHQWKETGIFDFFQHLPKEIYRHPDNSFATPSEVIRKYTPVDSLDVPHLVSWADIERDTSAWTGNEMQRSALNQIYSLRDSILRSNDMELIRQWRKLQTSDHFYYMCTKWFNDGDVHKYFNPHASPYEAFISFMNILNDIKMRIKEVNMASVTKDQAARILSGTSGYTCFWCSDGKVVANLDDLANALKKMSEKTYGYHVTKEKNDFSSWVNDVLSDAYLAKAIASVKDKTDMYKKVSARASELKKVAGSK